eukprot:g20777.t1
MTELYSITTDDEEDDGTVHEVFREVEEDEKEKEQVEEKVAEKIWINEDQHVRQAALLRVKAEASRRKLPATRKMLSVTGMLCDENVRQQSLGSWPQILSTSRASQAMEVESWTERPAGSQRASPRPLRGAVLLAIVGAMAMALSVATRDLSFAIPRDRRQALILLGSSIPAPAWAGDVFAKRREKAEKKEMEQKVDEQGRVLVEVARPTGTKKKLYFFDLPMVPGKNWGDYSRDDEKETGTILKGAFGTAKENNIFQTQVIAGKLDDEFLERVRSQNYTAGAGMIRWGHGWQKWGTTNGSY